MLSQDNVPHRIFTIRRRAGDHRFVSRNDRPGDGPLAVDANLDLATANARHAASRTATAEGCRVLIMAENNQGFMERVACVEPRVGPAGDGSFVVLL
jgi:hypothetical protein